jgi:GNAT superfamily N-acetyltransferase
MPDLITIRDAAPDEAAYLSALALRSKAYWGYSREFIQSCKTELTYRPSQIADERYHFVVAQLDAAAVGFYALEAISPRQFELEALFVDPQHIGAGVGRQLMQHALDSVAAKSGESLLIQGDPNAEKFYLAAGAKLIGTRESGSISGRHLPLFEILIRPLAGSGDDQTRGMGRPVSFQA